MARVAVKYNMLATTPTACRMLFVSVKDTRQVRALKQSSEGAANPSGRINRGIQT
jgi:hypothetical protein